MDHREEAALLRRITLHPGIFGGKPIIRGQRIAVEHVMELLAGGMSKEMILEQLYILEPEDIQACPVFARLTVANQRLPAHTKVDAPS